MFLLSQQCSVLQVFMKPQAEMLYHVIAQPNSRDAVHSMLGMNRQVRPRQ